MTYLGEESITSGKVSLMALQLVSPPPLILMSVRRPMLRPEFPPIHHQKFSLKQAHRPALALLTVPESKATRIADCESNFSYSDFAVSGPAGACFLSTDYCERRNVRSPFLDLFKLCDHRWWHWTIHLKRTVSWGRKSCKSLSSLHYL
jgi:hypothetical protein